MTTPCRGIVDVSRLAAIAPRVTRVTQRLPASSNQSFRYHIPRRIPPPTVTAQVSIALPNHPFTPSPITVSSRSANGPQIREIRAWRAAQQLPVEQSSLLKPLPQFGDMHWAQTRGATPHIGLRSMWKSPLQQSAGKRFFGTSLIRPFAGSSERRAAEVGKGSKANVPEAKSSDTPPAPTPEQNEHFYDRLHMPQFHRPTRDELLAAATGFWSRMKVRFKWSTIRSVRPFNIDEITGFISWILLGHVLWLVIGTTTFVSLAIFAINTVFAQETLAGWVGNYLTKSSGLTVVFESAVVPRWGDGVITFKNVFVSRRPGRSAKNSVTKGSPEAAAISAAAKDDNLNEDTNYTQFDITLGEVNVTLSFSKWWNSKGLLQNVEIKHVRGVVDRTHVFWTGERLDPKTYRHTHSPGDFEINSFKIEDLLVTVHQPSGFRPFPVSIYNADLPRLRKQWMFYDLLSANSMTGEFDKSLFTIHQRQTHSFTGAKLDEGDSEDDPWKKQSRIRVDGLNIDHLNRNVEGAFSWIHEGNVDIVADIMVPNDSDESVMKVMSDVYDRMEALTSGKANKSPKNDASHSANPESTANFPALSDADKRFLIMDLRVHLNDVRAVVPIFTRDLSYVNNALIRPIVAYINSRRTFIPINCRVMKRASDFDGSWTIFDSGLMDDVSAEMYEAFARDVQDEQARLRRFKTVGLWGLQVVAQAVFLGMAGNIA